MTSCIMPSLPSPCFPLSGNHSSTIFPSKTSSFTGTKPHAIRSSIENVHWKEKKKII